MAFLRNTRFVNGILWFVDAIGLQTVPPKLIKSSLCESRQSERPSPRNRNQSQGWKRGTWRLLKFFFKRATRLMRINRTTNQVWGNSIFPNSYLWPLIRQDTCVTLIDLCWPLIGMQITDHGVLMVSWLFAFLWAQMRTGTGDFDDDARRHDAVDSGGDGGGGGHAGRTRRPANPRRTARPSPARSLRLARHSGPADAVGAAASSGSHFFLFFLFFLSFFLFFLFFLVFVSCSFSFLTFAMGPFLSL